MQTQSNKLHYQKKVPFSLREDHVFSWRFIAMLTLMGCIVVTVLFVLLPVDHDTLTLYWFFPVSLLLASQLYFELRFTQLYEIKLLLLFLAWGCITIVLNYSRAQLVDSYEWFATICTAIFLCFSLPYAFDKEGAMRVLKLLALVMVGAVVLLSVASLVAIYAKNIAAKASSIFEGINIYGGRLYIDKHPNGSAPSPALGVILAGILLADTKKALKRVLIVLCAAVCFITLSLTCSRTAILGAGLAVAFEVAIALLQTLKGRIRATLRAFASLLVAAVALFAFYKGSEMVGQLSNIVLARQEAAATITSVAPEAPKLPQESESADGLAANDPYVSETNTESPTLSVPLNEREILTRDFSDANTFNGRTEIWLGVLNGIMENPTILLVGTGPTVASNVMAPYFPKNSPIGIFHNSLLGVFVAHGLPALLLTLSFLVLTALASVRISFGQKFDRPLAVRLLPAVLLFTVIEGMMEDFLFTSTMVNIVWVWFMITAGFIFYFSREMLAEPKS